MTRHKIRERTVFALYSTLINDSINVEYNPKVVLCDAFNMSYKDIDVVYKDVFVKALIEKENIIKSINEFLIDWDFSRLSYIVQAVFLLSYSETVFVKCVDKQVSINEAIEITRKYDSEEDTKYVNAVLERTLSKALGIESDYQGKVEYKPIHDKEDEIMKNLASNEYKLVKNDN